MWTAAAERVAKTLGIKIRITSIGWRQDFEDPFFKWSHVRGIEELGALLVRPDRTVAWRCQEIGKGQEKRLEEVMRRILGLIT